MSIFICVRLYMAMFCVSLVGSRRAIRLRYVLYCASIMQLISALLPNVASARYVHYGWRRPAVYAAAPTHRVASTPRFGSGVLGEAMRFLGAGNVTGMRGPWCADYASMVLRRTGRRPLANRNAASALAYGPRVGQPRPGDLIVLNTRRGFAQHVGFFAGWDHGNVVMVSGNWGHRVSRAPISRRAIAAFIRT